jgi:deoxyribose-phosphate aldolase
MNSQIELTLLEPTATLPEIEQVCREAVSSRYAAICIPPLLVKKAKELLAGSEVKIATVIGYPYGYSAIEAKLAEIILAMVDGAHEMAVSINITALKNADWQYLAKELHHVQQVIQRKEKVLKIVLPGNFINNDELTKCCDLYGAAGVNYISWYENDTDISTCIEKIKMLRQYLANAVKIEVFAGFEASEKIIKEMITAGADRIAVPFKRH